MKQYTVTGMSCAACSARVEKAVSQVPGVQSCAVSLLTNSMGVEGTASESDIIRAVEEAGYGAQSKDAAPTAQASAASQEDALADRETPRLKKRLFASLGFLIVLMYISMGHTMCGWPAPSFLAHNPLAIALYELLLALCCAYTLLCHSLCLLQLNVLTGISLLVLALQLLLPCL